MSKRRKCHYLGKGVIACGGKPTAHDLEEIEKFKRVASGVPQPMREAREYVGLTLGQAAKILGVERARLEAVEQDPSSCDDLLKRRMETAYDCKVQR